jgi:tRNA threonylcarbamoyladenosine biosynthesis protein TsaE
MENRSQKTEVMVTSEEGLRMVAKEILQSFPEQRVFLFRGPMGAGKTTFIKYFCKEIGISDEVTSPTFAIVFEYLDAEGNSAYHFDFYRIDKTEEVFDLGYEEYFYSGDFCFIEWPEKIPELLPPEFVYIEINEGNSSHDRLVAWQLRDKI